MSDDSQAPKAGGTLDLSTGKPAAPPPALPSPQMPDDPDPAIRAGRTLNLSTGRPGRARKAPPVAETLSGGPIIREKVDLSTKTVAPAPSTSVPPQAPKASTSSRPTSSRTPRGSNGKSRRGKAPTSASSSLADLLDPDVLAKLKGG